MSKFLLLSKTRLCRWLRPLRRDRKGSTAVEFAFIAPVLFAVILGTIDIGRYLWTLSTMQNAADEAARTFGIQHLSVADAQSKATSNLLGMSYGNFTVTALDDVIVSGSHFYEVKIVHNYSFMFPLSMVTPSATMTLVSHFPR